MVSVLLLVSHQMSSAASFQLTRSIAMVVPIVMFMVSPYHLISALLNLIGTSPSKLLPTIKRVMEPQRSSP